MLQAFRYLSKFKVLRGTPFDPFGYTEERQQERALILHYEEIIEGLLDTLSPENHTLAVEIARLPEHIRGFGHVKQRTTATVSEREARLLDAYHNPNAAPAVSAAE